MELILQVRNSFTQLQDDFNEACNDNRSTIDAVVFTVRKSANQRAQIHINVVKRNKRCFPSRVARARLPVK